MASKKIALLGRMDKKLSKSRLSEDDAILLGGKVKRAVSKKFRGTA